MELQEFGNFYSVNLFQDQTLSITPTACTVNNAWWNPVLENGCRMVAVRQQVNRKAGLISPHEQKMKREYFVSCFTIQWQHLTIWLFLVLCLSVRNQTSAFASFWSRTVFKVGSFSRGCTMPGSLFRIWNYYPALLTPGCSNLTPAGFDLYISYTFCKSAESPLCERLLTLKGWKLNNPGWKWIPDGKTARQSVNWKSVLVSPQGLKLNRELYWIQIATRHLPSASC